MVDSGRMSNPISLATRVGVLALAGEQLLLSDEKSSILLPLGTCTSFSPVSLRFVFN